MKEGSVRVSGGYMLRVVDMMQSPEMSPSRIASLTKRFSKGADLAGRLPMNSSRLKFSFPSSVEGGSVSTKALGLNIVEVVPENRYYHSPELRFSIIFVSIYGSLKNWCIFNITSIPANLKYMNRKRK